MDVRKQHVCLSGELAFGQNGWIHAHSSVWSTVLQKSLDWWRLNTFEPVAPEIG